MQKQVQSSADIPTQIQHLAEAQHMGEILAVYPRHYKATPLVIAISLVFFIGMLSIFVPFLSWSYFFLILAILGIAIYLLRVRAGIVHRDDHIIVYTQGFIFLNGSTTTAYCWDNVKHILRGTAPP